MKDSFRQARRILPFRIPLYRPDIPSIESSLLHLYIHRVASILPPCCIYRCSKSLNLS